MDQETQEAQPSNRVQLGKQIAITIAVFAATKTVEAVYDALIRKNKTIPTEPELEQ